MSAAAAALPAPAARSRREIMVVFAALMLAVLLAALDGTIVATALPTITAELGGLEPASWVVTGYLLASTISTPLYGKLGDLYGRKRVFQAAIVIFLIGSVLCGQSQGMGELIAFRTLQGLGGGGLIVLAQAIIGDIVSPRERGRYQGIIGAVFGVSSVAGPLLGGFLVDNASWRWIFYVNIPIGIVALAVIAVALRVPRAAPARAHRLLGDDPAQPRRWLLRAGHEPGRHDLRLGLDGRSSASASSPSSRLALIIPVERRAAEPVLPMSLFSSRVFTVAGAIGFIVGFALFGATTYLPLFLQIVTGASPTALGPRAAADDPRAARHLDRQRPDHRAVGSLSPVPDRGHGDHGRRLLAAVDDGALDEALSRARSTCSSSASGSASSCRCWCSPSRTTSTTATSAWRPRARRSSARSAAASASRSAARSSPTASPPSSRSSRASRPRSGRAASRATWSPSCRPPRGPRSSAPTPTR